ncbi:ADP-ribosylation factor-like protein 16 [Bulinus truncatus]|nr:ADP-ribosylation factor-like protein 16 [Bulinus truncatus]
MILLIGPSSAGKTLLLKRLQSNSSNSCTKEDVPSTIPTVGTNLMTVNVLKKAEVTIRELGGVMGPIWNNYYKESHAVMFMIDMSKHTQLAAACVELLTMLSHPLTQGLPLLLLLNKIDIQFGVSQLELASLLRLEDLFKTAPQKITVVESSAKTGHNLDKIARWIYEQYKLDESTSA